MRSCKCFLHLSKLTTLTHTRANSVVIQKAIILNIMKNIFKNRDTDVVMCIILVLLKKDNQSHQPSFKYWIVHKAIVMKNCVLVLGMQVTQYSVCKVQHHHKCIYTLANPTDLRDSLPNFALIYRLPISSTFVPILQPDSSHQEYYKLHQSLPYKSLRIIKSGYRHCVPVQGHSPHFYLVPHEYLHMILPVRECVEGMTENVQFLANNQHSQQGIC
jgi:hypothetical protein